MNRRSALETMMRAGAVATLSPMLGHLDPVTTAGVKGVLEQELPPVSLEGWKMTAVEVVYSPGEVDRAHRHPGFVFGYVLEGELRFQVDGQKEVTLHAGQMFYEQPGSVHRVSANASATRRCRFLAMIFADKHSALTTPA